jgi:hypothetical protein
MRRALTIAALLFLAGCAGVPAYRDAAVDLVDFKAFASDERVRYEPGAQDYAERVAALLEAAVTQVEAAHYRPFPRPVIVYICGTNACFEQKVPGAVRYTAAVIYDNRLLLAPRLFDREPERLYPILVHELSHLHLGQQLGHYTLRIPVWFHEGLASLVAASGGADLITEEEARNAIAAGNHFLPEAAHDETRRAYAGQWRLKIPMFYRQSMMFLSYLKAQSEEHFRQLIDALQNRASFDQAFAAAFGAGALELAQRYFGGFAGQPAGAP